MTVIYVDTLFLLNALVDYLLLLAAARLRGSPCGGCASWRGRRWAGCTQRPSFCLGWRSWPIPCADWRPLPSCW